jgi:hypothetical protein
LELVGPGDSELALGCISDGTGSIDSSLLPTAGQYSVVVNPEEDQTGEVTLRIIADHDQTIATSIGGEPVTVRISQPGATASVTFAGHTGQRIRVGLAAGTFPSQCGLVSLLAPGQSTMTETCVESGVGTIPATRLPVDGTYSVVLDPPGAEVGALRVSVVAAS